MSAATATLIAGGLAIVGALLGAVVGLVVEDRLRRRGEVRLYVRAWSEGYSVSDRDPEGRVFELRFFNDRDVNISLWNLRVEFYEGRTLLETQSPHRGFRSAPPGHSFQGRDPIPRRGIDLPSRTTRGEYLCLEAGGETLKRYKRADRIRFVATVVQRGERLVADLRTWDPLEVAPP